MRVLKIGLASLALAVLFAGVAPAYARDDKLPELAPLTTMRDQFVKTFNGRPLQVCQTEWESWNRAHGVCQDLATVSVQGQQLIEGLVVEFVFYDGIRYERVNDATSWSAVRDEDYDPDQTLNDAFFGVSYDATLTRVGPADISGVPTVQYQYWSHDQALNEAAGGQVTYDLFLSSDNQVLKSQFSSRGRFPGLGDGVLADAWAYIEINSPIIVTPPPAELVQATDGAA